MSICPRRVDHMTNLLDTVRSANPVVWIALTLGLLVGATAVLLVGPGAFVEAVTATVTRTVDILTSVWRTL